MARAWFVAGRLETSHTPLGSFEDWSVIIGGILQRAGIDGLRDKIAGSAAEEIGLTLRDPVRVYRAKRSLRLMRKLRAIVDEAGISPHPAWAALLANAANPESGIHISGSFPEILRVLSSSEARLLEALALRAERTMGLGFVATKSLTALQLAEKDLGTWDELFDIPP